MKPGKGFDPAMANLAYLVFGTLVVWLVPSAAGQFVLGTEDLPELWGDGEVSYHAVTQDRDHDYLAINRSWFDVDPSGEWVGLHLRTLDSKALSQNQDSYLIQCNMNATVQKDGEASGRIGWSWSSTWIPYPGIPQESNYTTYYPGGFGQGRDLATRFERTDGSPMYFHWWVKRSDLLGLGTELAALQGACFEAFHGPSAIINRDNATSQSLYSLVENRRVVAPDGSPDDIPSLAKNLPPATTSETVEADDGKRTAGLSATVTLAALVLILLARRRGSRLG